MSIGVNDDVQTTLQLLATDTRVAVDALRQTIVGGRDSGDAGGGAVAYFTRQEQELVHIAAISIGEQNDVLALLADGERQSLGDSRLDIGRGVAVGVRRSLESGCHVFRTKEKTCWRCRSGYFTAFLKFQRPAETPKK